MLRQCPLLKEFPSRHWDDLKHLLRLSEHSFKSDTSMLSQIMSHSGSSKSASAPKASTGMPVGRGVFCSIAATSSSCAQSAGLSKNMTSRQFKVLQVLLGSLFILQGG